MKKYRELIEKLDESYMKYLEIVSELDFMTPLSRSEYLSYVTDKYKKKMEKENEPYND